MASRVAVWIDPHEAIVVRIDGNVESIDEISSGLKHAAHAGNALHAQVPFMVPTEVNVEHPHSESHQWDCFLDDVIDRIGHADGIWILGPGDAKLELEKRLVGHPQLHARLRGIEPAETMPLTDLMKHVRQLFHVSM